MKCKLLIILTFVFLFFSCTDNSKNEDNIFKIGWIGVLTGDAANYGIAVKNGVELALEEINSDENNKRKIEIPVYEDDKADTKTGINAFNKIVSTFQPTVIIQAAASSVMLANIPNAEKNKIVYISPTCSSDNIKYGGDYIFRIWPSDSYQGTFIAKYILSKLNKINAAILYINNDYGVGLKNAFEKEFKILGGEIITQESFTAGAKDLRSQLLNIRQSDTEIIFIPSHITETLIALKQAKELGLKIPFFTDAAAYTSELANSNPSITQNMYVANLAWNADDDSPTIKEFVYKYQNKYSEKPDVYAAAGYDCIKVISLAANNAASTKSEDIKNEIYKIKNYRGVTGIISFDEYGEVQKEYKVFKIINNDFVEIK